MKLMKCIPCSNYTLKKECSSCGIETTKAGPARFSPQDTYGIYRRRMKKELIKNG